MEIEVKEIEYCKLNVSCVANTEEINTKRNEVVKIFMRAPIPGFRKGKATQQAIKHYYKNQIDEAVKRALAEEALQQSIVEKSLRPLGAPHFNSIFMGLDNAFSCNFTIHNKPDFELMDFKSMEVPKPHVAMTAEDYAQKIFQNLREQHGEKLPFDENDVASMGDMISVSYDAFADGIKQDNLCAEDETFALGTSKIANFDENVVGMKLNETREFNILVPETAASELAGKPLTFKVTLHMGLKLNPAPLDDQLAVKLGKTTFSELEIIVRAEAANVLDQQTRNALQQSVIARLIAGHDFKVPDWLALSEAKYLAANAKVDWDTLEDAVKEAYVNQAARNVKLSLVLDKMRECEPEAQLSDQEVMDIVKGHLNLSSGKSVEEALKEINNLGYLQVLYNRIRDEYTIDFAVKSVKVIE